MLLTDHFVFIHQPKTGGTFVTTMLRKLYEPRSVLARLGATLRYTPTMIDTQAHETCSEIPASHRDKPIIATLRHPFDRYVSQFEFPWWRKNHGSVQDVESLRARYPAFPDLDFAQFVECADELLGRRQTFAAFKSALVGFQTNQFLRFFFREPDRLLPNLTEDIIENGDYRDSMYPVTFLRTERLNEDLHAFLNCIESLPGDPTFILDAQKVYPPRSRRDASRHWHEYYDRTLYERLRHQERLLFDLFPEFDDGWRPAR